MNKFILIAICPLFIFFSNCKKNNNSEQEISEHYDLSKAPHGQLADIFSDVEVVPLEFAGEDYPGEAHKFIVYDSLILITDYHTTVHLFTTDGKYISSSSEKQGEGPEEFPFSMGTTWNSLTNSVEIITPSKLISYDKYFNYIKESRLPTYIGKDNEPSFFFHYIYSLSDSVHLMRSTGDPYRLVVYNSNTEQLGDYISYNDDVITSYNFQLKKFFDINDSKTYYIPGAMTNRIYEFNADNLTIHPIVEFTTGPNGVTKQYISDLNMDEKELGFFILSCERNMLLNTLPNAHYFITMLKEGENHLRSFYYVFIDRNTGEMTRIDMYKNGHLNMPMFKDIDDEFAYAVTPKDELEEMPWLLLNNESKADSILNSIDDESLVILKYKF